MLRNGIAHHMDPSRHTRHTEERNGKFVKGPARGKLGKGRGGRVKRSR